MVNWNIVCFENRGGELGVRNFVALSEALLGALSNEVGALWK